jgi:TetR/AcrR family transcriptional repressor of nem operon
MKAAGLTHGPFYNHFASKEALMAETLTRELQRATSEFDSLPAAQQGKAQYADYYLRRHKYFYVKNVIHMGNFDL